MLQSPRYASSTELSTGPEGVILDRRRGFKGFFVFFLREILSEGCQASYVLVSATQWTFGRAAKSDVEHLSQGLVTDNRETPFTRLTRGQRNDYGGKRGEKNLVPVPVWWLAKIAIV